jgi:hypothetical protein
MGKYDFNHVCPLRRSALSFSIADSFVSLNLHMEQPENLQPVNAADASLLQKLPGRKPPVQFDEANFDKNFKPRGAIAFFILLVILGLIIWFGVYLIMLQRV